MRRFWIAAAVMVLVACSASADPITYTFVNANSTVSGVNTQAPGNPATTQGANYFSFFADAGAAIDIEVNRTAGHYDPAMGVWTGTYADTGDLAFFDANFITFGDDDDPPNVPGPFGDPHQGFVAPTTGMYTVAVTNFASNAGPPNPFDITITGNSNLAVPEPLSVALFGGIAVACIAGIRRRMTKG